MGGGVKHAIMQTQVKYNVYAKCKQVAYAKKARIAYHMYTLKNLRITSV